MNTRTMTLCALAGCCGSPALAQNATRYTITDLGSIAETHPGNSFNGIGINNAGEATGFFFNTAGGYGAFYWDGQAITDIGSLGGDAAFPRGIGPDGSIIGFSDLSIIQENGIPLQHAFLYRDGVMTDLGTLGGTYSVAEDVNAAGQVVGSSMRPEPDHYSHAFLWENGVMTDLGTLGGPFSDAQAINNAGQIVGWSWAASSSNRRAVLWLTSGEMIDLGDLGAGVAEAVDINNAGQVVGISPIPNGDRHTFLWQGGTMIDIGTLSNAGEDESIYETPALVDMLATSINNAGQIVGTASPVPANSLPGPFIYDEAGVRNLNSLIDLSSGWVIRYARDINDSGQIIASARMNGVAPTRAVLLTPRCIADVSDPEGVLDFSDVVAFLVAFSEQSPIADVAPPFDQHNFTDIFTFLGAFSDGCP